MWRRTAPRCAADCAARVPAPERRSAPAGPAPDGTTPPQHGEPGLPALRQRTRGLASRRGCRSGSDHQDGHSARPPANAVTGRNGRSGRPGGDQAARSHGPMTRRFAQVTDSSQRWLSAWNPASASSPAGEAARSEYAFGGPGGRRCCPFLLYSLVDPFEFRC